MAKKTKNNQPKTYPMRLTCQEAGYCLSLVKETDCNLFLSLNSICRERTSTVVVDQTFDWENVQSIEN